MIGKGRSMSEKGRSRSGKGRSRSGRGWSMICRGQSRRRKRRSFFFFFKSFIPEDKFIKPTCFGAVSSGNRETFCSGEKKLIKN